jgi:hypothetical protein
MLYKYAKCVSAVQANLEIKYVYRFRHTLAIAASLSALPPPKKVNFPTG